MEFFEDWPGYFQVLWNWSDRLLDGLWVTIQLSIYGGLLAFVIAVALGLMAGSPSLWLRAPARVLIEVFRGISLVVLLFWLMYILPLLWMYNPGLPFRGIVESTFLLGVFALGLNYGAYGAEAVRASLTTVPKGQWEATTALSMSWPHKIRRVIFPQAWALMIPSLTNLWVHLLKGSAIAYVIPLVSDFTAQLNQLRRPTDIWFSHAFIGLVIYFLLALVITVFMQALEARAKHKLGRGPSLREILSPAPKAVIPETSPAGQPQQKSTAGGER
ncbi:amino acid ABC transporter permease [Nesterenkonia alkaliphila]|uniref:ABC transporter permease subunit n=1 Tax=Nesterenkonia alkaliphila TaxID=1463631 RepID=A0A7K1UGR4_9MICC|nr:amino acid ABC transporter permease [Nesterenkonia alkaliphila]MVT25667.1 ABC transporter permease subunit [Nesterenkonia alkaliphila]GFZ84987.1 ectoine/hydroxyectoine ABC transporter permease subunit EhuC [Nesterenkonia alkaliphila]